MYVFSNVFDDFSSKVADNWIVLATMLACLASYVAGLIYAAKKDRDDKIEVNNTYVAHLKVDARKV